MSLHSLPSLWLLPALGSALLTLCPAAGQGMDFDQLRQLAKDKAAKPYEPAPDNLDAFWKGLSYDQHRDIRFQMEKGLWWDQKLPFSIDFFHPGWTAKKTVTVHETVGDQSQPLKFDLGLFNYGKQQVPTSVPPPPGYAGWRARYHLNSPEYMDEFLVFLGASYFRSIPAKTPYGLSARGLSLNSGLPGVPEEFPDFTEFWLSKPAPDSKELIVMALLEGPSVSGAYRFKILPGAETIMDVQAEITLRKEVKQLGLVPFSSMFWYGENTHPKPFDFRPEIHDSDGLTMTLASGEQHWRPLDHHERDFRHCVFTLENPKSYALTQRDRDFTSYQDQEALYHDRPTVVVEPALGMEKGKLHLIEMPTADETNDNVILVWEPVTHPRVGSSFLYSYKLRWVRDPQPPAGLFQVRATRIGNPVQQADQVLFTIDYANPLQPVEKQGDPKWDDIKGWKPKVNILGKDNVKLVHSDITDLSMPNVNALPAGLGQSSSVHMSQVLRAFFVVEPGAHTDLDLTCELVDTTGKVRSERWVYLWKK
jgi:periplasmic glucans biosynthesis protein